MSCTEAQTQMPFGNSSQRSSRRDSMKIAQRFNAGLDAHKRSQAPPGAAETEMENRSAAPMGLAGFSNAKPSVETLGYCRIPLRGKELRQRHANSRKALGPTQMPRAAPFQRAISHAVFRPPSRHVSPGFPRALLLLSLGVLP